MNCTQNSIKYLFLYTLLVFLYPINVKTAERIGLKFCMGPHAISGNVVDAKNKKKFENPQKKLNPKFFF